MGYVANSRMFLLGYSLVRETYCFLFRNLVLKWLVCKRIFRNFENRLQEKRRVAPPWMFSQRNNPYCDLLENCCKYKNLSINNQIKHGKD